MVGVLVEHIPAEVCTRCGEATFSRTTTEKIRQVVHGAGKDIVRVMGMYMATPGDACVAPTGVVEARVYGGGCGVVSSVVNSSLHFDTRYLMDGVRMIEVSVATPGDACVAPTGVLKR